MSDTQSAVNEEEIAEKASKPSLRERLKPTKKEPAIELGGNITVSLIPESHKRSVEARKSKNSWTIIFGTTVLACVISGAAMFAFNLQVQSQVASERSQQEAVDLSISRHAEVHQAMESEEVAKQLLNGAAGNEIDWGRLVGMIEQQLPQGTQIASLAVTNGGLVDDEVSSSITLNLTSSTTFGYSDSLNAIENISGVEQVEIGGLSVSGDGGYSYQMSFTYDTSILTERFSVEAPTPASDAGPENPESGTSTEEDPNIDPVTGLPYDEPVMEEPEMMEEDMGVSPDGVPLDENPLEEPILDEPVEEIPVEEGE